VNDDEDFIEYIGDASNPPVRSTRDVADYFDMSPQGALKRLKELREAGLVSGRDLNKVWIWWVPDDEEPSES
jgi:DNA-binding Lrp family transcriptional regulator